MASAPAADGFSAIGIVERGWRMAVPFKTPRAASATMRRMALQMRLGWVIVYVDEPPAAAEFYEKTFGLRGSFGAPGGSYAQPDPGPPKRASAPPARGEKNFDGGVRRAGCDAQAPNAEIALIHDAVDAAYAVA